MRKKYLCAVAATLLLFQSCTKNNPGSNPAPNPPGGGSGGGSSNLTVTSISPTNPYPDDEFTINGTGFNSNTALDTVEFGHLINGNFAAWHGGVPDQWESLCTVVSASATQLKVKAVNPFGLDFVSFDLVPSSIAVAQIRTGGKKVVTPVINFTRLMTLNGINDVDANNSWVRPADSMDINGKGYNKTGLNVSIGTTALSNFKVDSTAYSARVSLRLPKNFFGEQNDETVTQTRNLTVTNRDGKSVTKEFTFYMSPFMRVFTMQPESNTYSLSGLNGSGGVIKIVVVERNLKNDATIYVDSNTGYHAESGLGVSGFPDNTTLSLSPSSLTTGIYTVRIERGTTLYALCNFTLTQ